MARIKQLSKHLINQIAAGEVIERPASVVKELVENSVDAGSTKISIEITNDCRNIRVADNGSGIHPDDIMLAFSKHATSKISTDEDLYAIETLGFRGEALSSIISIAKVTCTTRTKDFDNGTKVTCENSEVHQVQTGCAVGTIMDGDRGQESKPKAGLAGEEENQPPRRMLCLAGAVSAARVQPPGMQGAEPLA